MVHMYRTMVQQATCCNAAYRMCCILYRTESKIIMLKAFMFFSIEKKCIPSTQDIKNSGKI